MAPWRPSSLILLVLTSVIARDELPRVLAPADGADILRGLDLRNADGTRMVFRPSERDLTDVPAAISRFCADHQPQDLVAGCVVMVTAAVKRENALRAQPALRRERKLLKLQPTVLAADFIELRGRGPTGAPVTNISRGAVTEGLATACAIQQGMSLDSIVEPSRFDEIESCYYGLLQELRARGIRLYPARPVEARFQFQTPQDHQLIRLDSHVNVTLAAEPRVGLHEYGFLVVGGEVFDVILPDAATLARNPHQAALYSYGLI